MISHNQRMDPGMPLLTKFDLVHLLPPLALLAALARDAFAPRSKTLPNWFDWFDSLESATRTRRFWDVAERLLHGAGAQFAMISHDQRMDWTRHVPVSEPVGRGAEPLGGRCWCGPGKGRAEPLGVGAGGGPGKGRAEPLGGRCWRLSWKGRRFQVKGEPFLRWSRSGTAIPHSLPIG
jgi:hypothetical protein